MKRTLFPVCSFCCVLEVLPLTLCAQEENQSPVASLQEKLEADVSHSFVSSQSPVLKAVFLTSNPKLKPSIKDLEEGLYTEEIEVPGGDREINAEVFNKFYGRHLNKELLVEIKSSIISYYRENGRPIMTVDIPEQDITDGVITLVIKEGRVGNVTIQGNRWFPSSLFLNQMDLGSGDVINSKDILQNLAWSNRNPFHQADVAFAPGKLPGTTDVEVFVQDRFPLRSYVGADNTGNHNTGDARYFVGLNWGNAFYTDGQLSYQYTVGPNLHRFQSHTVDYVAPLPWHNTLEIYGGYSRVRPDIAGFGTKGHSGQASLRYTIPLGALYKNYVNEIAFGGDWKNMNNNLEFFSDEPGLVTTSLVNLSQFILRYDFGYKSKHHKIAFSPEVYWSPGKIMSHQSNEAYDKLRPHAVNHYVYGQLNLGYDLIFNKGWTLSFLTRFQGANHTLLPSEEFGLGGYDTVRGYEEREADVDNAFCGNFEARTMPFSFYKKRDELVLLGFFDYGTGYNIHPLPGETKWHRLYSLGPGLRYHFDRYFTLRLDVGYRLHKVQFGKEPGFKVHAGAILSY